MFFAANPKGTVPLALDEESREIEQKIRAAEHRLEFITKWAVRPDDLLQVLNEYRPQIVHFSGHGSPTDEIMLLDASGNPKPVSKAAMKQLFKALKDNIRVVVLNTCFSRPQAEAITEVIDCAVGMNKAIGDQAAIVFAASFYRALGFGRSVHEAFDQGRTAIMLEGVPEEDAPELLCRIGVDPDHIFLVGQNANTARQISASTTLVTDATPSPPPVPPRVFVSYAWGDDKSNEGFQREMVVDHLCKAVQDSGWQVIRDKKVLRYGELISTFMKALGQADLVIVILSAKYMRSPYCMTELYAIYNNACQEKQRFLDRILPLVLDDARIGSWRDRAEHAAHWQAEFQAMEGSYQHLGEQDFRLYKVMKDWHNHISDILAYINDVLSPCGFETIVADDFAVLRQILQQTRPND
jgi:hypothetical protein